MAYTYVLFQKYKVLMIYISIRKHKFVRISHSSIFKCKSDPAWSVKPEVEISLGSLAPNIKKNIHSHSSSPSAVNELL